jgi:hypothetical protein
MRLTFDIPDEQHEVLVRYIPHGMRKYTYRALIQGFVEQLEKDPQAVMHKLIDRQLDFLSMATKGIDDGFNQRAKKSASSNGEGEDRLDSPSSPQKEGAD